MKGLPSGFVSRPATLADAGCLADMMNCYSQQIGRPGVLNTAERVRMQLNTPGFDLETETRVVVSPHGQLVAFAFISDLSESHCRIQSSAIVHPCYTGLGIGAALALWTEQRARVAAMQASADADVRIQQGVCARDTAAVALLKKQGFVIARHFWLMEIVLGKTPESPSLPSGVRMRTFDSRHDREELFDAVSEAFQDHWGASSNTDWSAWQVRLENEIDRDPEFDPDLWILAVDSEIIVGMSLSTMHAGSDERLGTIHTLGIRPAWRRQGIAQALLRQTFRTMFKKGTRTIRLHVDSESPNKATDLYMKAGMSIADSAVLLEKELRRNPDTEGKS